MRDKDRHRDDALVLASSVGAAVRKSSVAEKSSYSEYQDELRWDFWFHCAYCTISEVEAGGVRFTIDHYLPLARYPELETTYNNLMWACDSCNQYKGAAPTQRHAARGLRFLKVDADNPDDHVALSAVSPTRVEPKSQEVGEYTIQRLNLNREPLRRLRAARERLYKSSEVIRRGIRALQGQRIQDLPIRARAKFLELRETVIGRGQGASDLVDETLVRESLRSMLVDRPIACDQDAAARKAYLKRINAPLVAVIVSGPHAPK